MYSTLDQEDYSLTFDDITLIPCAQGHAFNFPSRSDWKKFFSVNRLPVVAAPMCSYDFELYAALSTERITTYLPRPDFIPRSNLSDETKDFLLHQYSKDYIDGGYLWMNNRVPSLRIPEAFDYSDKNYKILLNLLSFYRDHREDSFLDIKDHPLFLIDIAYPVSQRVSDFFANLAQLAESLSVPLDFTMSIGNFFSQRQAQLFVRGIKHRHKSLKDLTILCRVGIGGGSACTTRTSTGFGLGSASSMLDTDPREDDFHTIADGGYYANGNIIKALAFGAREVMLGRVFAELSENHAISSYSGLASVNFSNASVEGEERPIVHRNMTVSEWKANFTENLITALCFAGAEVPKESSPHCIAQAFGESGIQYKISTPSGLVEARTR